MEINSVELQQKINQGEKLMVEFWAEWCGPCKMMKPIFEKVASSNQSDVKMYTLNIDNNHEIAVSLGVRSIPTIKMFNSGQVVQTKVGFINESQINEIEGDITPEQAIQKAMPIVTKIENSPEFQKVAKEIANDPNLKAQLEKVLTQSGVQADLNEEEGGLDSSDMKKLMLTFAKKGEQLQEADETNKLKGYLAKSPLSSELQSKLLMVIGAAAPLAAGVRAANPVVMGAAVGYMLFAFGKALYDETR